jgi:hydrogenase expression/formation protein HypE
MCGATPLFFSAGFVIEEGFPMADLERVVASMAAACRMVGAPLVTGDTKVVDKGKGDGLFVNTSGVGRVRDGVRVAPDQARPGDVVLVSGPVGDHGIAVMAAREGIDFETALRSDSAPVNRLVDALLDAVPGTRVLRDPTRGGLATALCEVATASRVGLSVDEEAVPVREEVRAACELLGFDPLYVACEGRFLAVVPAEAAQAALAALRGQESGAGARRIGVVTSEDPGRVVLATRLGTRRLLDKLSGEQLPRIC